MRAPISGRPIAVTLREGTQSGPGDCVKYLTNNERISAMKFENLPRDFQIPAGFAPVEEPNSVPAITHSKESLEFEAAWRQALRLQYAPDRRRIWNLRACTRVRANTAKFWTGWKVGRLSQFLLLKYLEGQLHLEKMSFKKSYLGRCPKA
jgi:hypothetical protein